jgi:hypothetical protein
MDIFDYGKKYTGCKFIFTLCQAENEYIFKTHVKLANLSKINRMLTKLTSKISSYVVNCYHFRNLVKRIKTEESIEGKVITTEYVRMTTMNVNPESDQIFEIRKEEKITDEFFPTLSEYHIETRTEKKIYKIHACNVIVNAYRDKLVMIQIEYNNVKYDKENLKQIDGLLKELKSMLK